MAHLIGMCQCDLIQLNLKSHVDQNIIIRLGSKYQVSKVNVDGANYETQGGIVKLHLKARENVILVWDLN